MTDREQLIEHRKQIILSKMKGKTEAEKNRAIKNLDRMNFTDHDDFMSYVKEFTGTSSNDSVKQATEEELEEIAGYMFPSENIHQKLYKPAPGEASQSELDEVFKHLKI